MFEILTGFFYNDIGIDLGTMNTLVYVKGKGIKLNEPSVVAVQADGNNKVIAVGSEAKRMLGSNPGTITAARPMRNGGILDPGITQKMLRSFISSVSNPFCIMQPRVVVAVPSQVTVIERQAVIDAVRNAGARDVRLVEEPFAAAIGAGLPVTEPTANMIVDIGGGTAEIAIISLGGIVHCTSERFAGDSMDEAIAAYMKQQYNLSIGELTAEKVKKQIGSALPFKDIGDESLGFEEKIMDVSGLKMDAHGNNMPCTQTISSEEVRKALMGPLEHIQEGIARTLAQCRPELAGALTHNGITFTGGGSMLPGLSRLFGNHFKIIVHSDPEPLFAVTKGLAKIIENTNLFDSPQARLVGVTC